MYKYALRTFLQAACFMNHFKPCHFEQGPLFCTPSLAERCFLPFLYPFNIHSAIRPVFIFHWTIQFIRFLYCQTIERKLLFFQRKVQFLFYLYFLTLKSPPFSPDMPILELQEMAITSSQNNSVKLRRSSNMAITSIYENSSDVNNYKQDNQSKT